MNEFIFALHIISIICSLFIALRLGPYALVGLICVFAVLMNLLVTKQMPLVGLTVTTTDAYAVGVTLGLNLLQEYWGRILAQRAIWISFFTTLVTVAAGIIQVWYVPAPVDTMHPHFVALFAFTPRIVIASLVSYLCVMHLDAWLYGYLKKRLASRWLVARNYASITVTQGLDTILFSVLGLYGIVAHVGHIMVFSYLVKGAVILIATPAVALARYFVSTESAS